MKLREALLAAMWLVGCDDQVEEGPPPQSTSTPEWGETLGQTPGPTEVLLSSPEPGTPTPEVSSPGAESPTAPPVSPSSLPETASPLATSPGYSSPTPEGVTVSPPTPSPTDTSSPTPYPPTPDWASPTTSPTPPPPLSPTPDPASPTPAASPSESASPGTTSPPPGTPSPTAEETPTLPLTTPFPCQELSDGGVILDLRSVHIEGEILIGGETRLATSHAGFLQLETQQNERVVMDSATEGYYTTNLLPGVFDLIYHRNQAEGVPPEVPGNTNFKLTSHLRIAGDQVRTIDIPTCQPALNVAAQGDTGVGRGVVVAWGPGGDRTEVTDTRGARNYVIPGTYDLRYEWKSDGPGIPRNVGADLALQVPVDQSTQIDFPLKAVHVYGGLTLDGEVFQNSSYGDIYLRKNGLGNAWLGRTDQGSFDTWVLPGTYQVRYQRMFGTEAPQNLFADLPITIVVEEEGQYDINLDVVTLHLRVTVDGIDLRGGDNSATLSLRSTKGDSVALGDLNEGDLYTSMVVNPSDRYDLYYQYRAGGDIPHNENAKLMEGLAIVDGEVLEVDIPRVEISGEIDLMGAVPTDPADLILTAGGDRATIGQVQDHVFEAWILPGTYTLNWASRADTMTSPRNSLAPILGPLEVETDTSLSVDVPRSTLEGFVMLNGAVIAAQGMGIYATQGGDRILLTTQFGSFAAPVIPGRYNLIYDNLYGEHVVPENRNHLLGCVDVPTSF